ncbi:MAG: NAD(P)H-dependent oxidoreductase subunit E [Thermodesulfobacteriota bacterium]
MFARFTRKATIDGKMVSFRKGTTILEAARRAGIEIPTLCHIEGHPPTGVCRVCVVEVEWARTLAGSCHTPIAEGMVIHTRSPRVLDVRRGVVELMLAAHTGNCVSDPNADSCGLHCLASNQEVGAPRFAIAQPRSYPAEDANPYVRRDLSKCIMCRRCITACGEIAGKRILSVGYRGFASKIIAGYDAALTMEACRDCGVCIEYCPTGALSDPRREPVTRPGGKSGPGRRRESSKHAPESACARLLPLLKEELGRKGSLSAESMATAARKTGLSLAETFGVSSFYAFLPREGGEVNRIRVCRCLPCELKAGRAVMAALQRELGIGPGETTSDGRFSLELAGCIGACDQAPAMLVNDELYGNVHPDRIADILRAY